MDWDWWWQDIYHKLWPEPYDIMVSLKQEELKKLCKDAYDAGVLYGKWAMYKKHVEITQARTRE